MSAAPLRMSSSPSSFLTKLVQTCRPFNTLANVGERPAQQQFPQFSSASELSQYVDSHLASMDCTTLSLFINRSSVVSKKLSDGREFRSSPAIRKVVSSAVKGFTSENGDTASFLLNGISSFRPPSHLPVPLYLKEAGEKFAKLLMSKKISLSANEFATALMALCRLDAKDLRLRDFVEKSLPIHIPELTPASSRMMMKVCHELGIKSNANPELFNMLDAKLIESLDRFTNPDVINSLVTFTTTRHIVNEVIVRCIELLTQHPALFEVEELVTAAHALVHLGRFSNAAVARPILDQIQKRVRSVRKIFVLSRILDVVCFSILGGLSQFANELIGLLAASDIPKSPSIKISIAHAICSFNLQERKPLLQTFIRDFADLSFSPQSNMFRLVEVFESANHDMNIKAELPRAIQTQLAEFYNKRKIDTSHTFTVRAVQESMQKLPKKYHLSLQPGVQVGPFIPFLVDTTNKVVIDILNHEEPFRLRRHLYENLGYHTHSFFKRNITPEVLEMMLAPIMVKLGRMTMEESSALRDARRQSGAKYLAAFTLHLAHYASPARRL